MASVLQPVIRSTPAPPRQLRGQQTLWGSWFGHRSYGWCLVSAPSCVIVYCKLDANLPQYPLYVNCKFLIVTSNSLLVATVTFFLLAIKDVRTSTASKSQVFSLYYLWNRMFPIIITILYINIWLHRLSVMISVMLLSNSYHLNIVCYNKKSVS